MIAVEEVLAVEVARDEAGAGQWIGWGPAFPPAEQRRQRRLDRERLSFGQGGLSASALAVICPPVPTPVMMASIGASAKSRGIS